MKKLFSKLMLVAMAAMTFTACEDVPEPYPVPQPTPEEEITYKGSGTLESPYTCDDVIKYVQSLDGEESENEVYVKGIVTEVESAFSTQYGNADFNMSDDGQPSNVFKAYHVLYLGKKKWTTGQTQVKVGDEVIICSRVVNFRGNTPETVFDKNGYNGYLYSLNGVSEGGGGGEQPSGEPKGDGTLQNPYNVAAAIAKCKEIGSTESSEKYYVKGIVDANATADASYHNITFDIVDNGNEAKFKCYQVAGTDGKALPDGFSVNKGDEVVVYGPIYNYKGNTPETAGKSAAYIVTVNGKSTNEGGQQQETKVVGSIDQPVSTTDAVKVIEQLEDNEKTQEFYYVKGIVTSIKTSESDIAKYKNIDYYIADEQMSNYQLQVFRGKNLGNTDFTSADQLKVGDEVIVYGQLTKYKNDSGIIPEMAQGNYLVKRNSETSGNGENPQSGDGIGVLEGQTLTLNCAGLDIPSSPTDITLVDGTTLTLEKNDGNTKPAYNANYGEIRLYARNSMSINSREKKIASVKLFCTVNTSNNQICVGNEGEVTGSAGTVTVNSAEKFIEATNIGQNTFTLTNGFKEKNSGGVQIRFNKMVITYAE